MNLTKRLTALSLAAALTLGLAACGGKQNPNPAAENFQGAHCFPSAFINDRRAGVILALPYSDISPQVLLRLAEEAPQAVIIVHSGHGLWVGVTGHQGGRVLRTDLAQDEMLGFISVVPA